MKKLFGFQSKSKKSESTTAVPTLSITTSPASPGPNVLTAKPDTPAGKRIDKEQMSPTLSTRPTARSEFELWRKMEVIPTEDALLIRPKQVDFDYDAISTSTKARGRHLKIAWGNHKPIQVEEVQGIVASPQMSSTADISINTNSDWNEGSLEIFGIIGFMSLLSGSYLLVVTAINNIGNYGTGSLHVKWAPLHVPNVTPDADSILTSSPTSSSGVSTPTSSLNGGGVAIAPLAKTLAERLSFWKSKRASKDGEAELIASRAASGDHETLGDLLDEIDKGDATTVESTRAIEDIVVAAAPEPLTVQEKHDRLEEKVLRETVRQFTRGGMYFSYSLDLSSSLQRKQQQIERLKKRESILTDLNALGDWSPLESGEVAQPWKEPLPNVPLWRRVDRRFWWNEHLLQPLIEAELHSYALPILQGYFQSAKFHIPLGDDIQTPTPQRSGQLSDILVPTSPSVEVEYVVISRRSRERAGLRYQRRGIDDDSHVANFVETEAIMRIIREGTENVFSFVQIRGSIPLYWSQSGYGLKPPPQLDASKTPSQHLQAIKSHFSSAASRYGPVNCVNLAEQHGKEGALTDAFRNYMDELNPPDAKYNECGIALHFFSPLTVL
ncbi:hypothetical protein FRC18_000223 [Serendipita sp. 400]|nr:hypothetical protein FRC18_000223 [Serendipita sp. 400]